MTNGSKKDVITRLKANDNVVCIDQIVTVSLIEFEQKKQYDFQ